MVQTLTTAEFLSLPGWMMQNRHLYITVNIVIVDVTDEDKAKATRLHQFISAAVKLINILFPFLASDSRHKQNNTSQQLHRLPADCCLEAGNLIASIAVRAESHSAYAL